MDTQLDSSGKQDGSLWCVNLAVLLGYKTCSTLEDNKAIALTQMRDIKIFLWIKPSPDLPILTVSQTSAFSLLLDNSVKTRALQAKSRGSSRLHFNALGGGSAAATDMSNLRL